MATSMKIGFGNLTCCRLLHMRNAAAFVKQKLEYSNRTSDKDTSNRVPAVGMSKDGQTLVSWHPEPVHPYEHTRPIVYDQQEAGAGTSLVLKEQVIRQYETRLRPDGPSVQELSAITHTTKHRWYPKPEKKYRKRNPPKDRDHV